MTSPRKMATVPFLALALSCGQSSQTVRPDNSTAEGQRQLAQEESVAAVREERAARIPPQEPNLSESGGNNPQGYY